MNAQDIIITTNNDTIGCIILDYLESKIVYKESENGKIQYILYDEVISYKENKSEKNKERKDKIHKVNNRKKRELNSAFTFGFHNGINTAGLTISMYSYPKVKDSTFFMAPIFSSTIYLPHRKKFTDYSSVMHTTGKIGINTFKRKANNIYINLSLSAMLCNEYIKDNYRNSYSNTKIGLELTQGLYYISKSKEGAILGISIYEILINSELYNFDIGPRIIVGVKF